MKETFDKMLKHPFITAMVVSSIAGSVVKIIKAVKTVKTAK